MAAPKKTFDMEAVGKAAVAAVSTQTHNGGTATVASVIDGMQKSGSDIATTRLKVLLKELSDANRLEGFYLRRGSGFVHENDVPRTAKVAVNKPKKAKKKAKKSAAPKLSPSSIAEEIRAQERQAAEDEYRAQVRAEERTRLGLTG